MSRVKDDFNTRIEIFDKSDEAKGDTANYSDPRPSPESEQEDWNHRTKCYRTPLRKKEEPEQVQCTRQGHKNYRFGQNPDLLDLFSGAKRSRLSRGLAYLPWLRVHHIFLLTRGIGSEKKTFVSSLRRHYPDQVQRVDGDEAILSAGSYPSSPSSKWDPNPLFKNWPMMEQLISHSVSLKK